MCRTAEQCEEAERRVQIILGRLGLELHPDKTRRVDLSWGRQGFDFLGCHLHKRMSGLMWERQGRKAYFNLYYVGSKKLASYLVTTGKGHILINPDFERTVPLIRESIEKLGFKLAVVKILLSSHVHDDHVEGLRC